MHEPPPNRRLRGRALRRTRRGAVAVEACIVIAMMVGVVLGTWFMRQVFSGKLLTITAGRADAWKDALNGCDTSGGVSSLYDKLHEQSKDPSQKVCNDPDNCGDGTVDGLNADGSSTPAWFPTGSAPEAQKSINVAEDSLYSATLVTHYKFSCNDKPHDELDLGGSLSDVINQVTKIPKEEVPPDQVAQDCYQKQFVWSKWKKVDHDTNDFCNGTYIVLGSTYFKREDVNLNDVPP